VFLFFIYLFIYLSKQHKPDFLRPEGIRKFAVLTQATSHKPKATQNTRQYLALTSLNKDEMHYGI
jgi:hypothetical protein